MSFDEMLTLVENSRIGSETIFKKLTDFETSDRQRKREKDMKDALLQSTKDELIKLEMALDKIQEIRKIHSHARLEVSNNISMHTKN